MRMLSWMCGHTRKDRIWNDYIRENIGVAAIEEEKMTENIGRWMIFNSVKRRREKPKRT